MWGRQAEALVCDPNRLPAMTMAMRSPAHSGCKGRSQTKVSAKGPLKGSARGLGPTYGAWFPQEPWGELLYLGWEGCEVGVARGGGVEDTLVRSVP